ncbi:MAG: response regulator transcription factor [Solirubrobacteraceae bacterium]
MPVPVGMARSSVSATDVERLVAAADSLASLGSLEALRQRAVDIVTELVAATLVAWNEVDLEGHAIAAVMSPPPDQFNAHERAMMEAAFIEHVGDHPVIAHYRRTRDGRPYAISDFLSARAFHQTGIYRHFYRHLGAEDQLSFVLPDPFLIIGVALNRARRGFSARDRQVCNLLRPHLVQAYRGVEAATLMKRMTSTFELAAAERGLGFIRVDDEGRPYETSITAQSILHRFFDLLSTSLLPDEISQWLARDRGRTSPAELVLYRPDGRRLIVHRAPAASGDLLLLSEQPKGPLDTRKLGLTAREAEVLALVREGLATKRIASTIGISPRTVDKHIQHALDKLGVRTRMQAIVLIDHVSPLSTADGEPLSDGLPSSSRSALAANPRSTADR